MAAKAFLVVCAFALLIESIYTQCAGIPGPAYAAEEYRLLANNIAYGGFGPYNTPGFAPGGYSNCGLNIAPTSGGGFAVTSISPIAPTGISVVSENTIEGALSIVGELPFLSAVALEGALPTAGAGGINYGCGNGAVGIVSEGIAPGYPAGLGYGPAGLAGGLPYGPGIGGLGYGARGYGLGGCGAIY